MKLRAMYIACMIICTALVVHAGSGGGRLGSNIRVHSGKFGNFDREYENGQVRWDISNDHCGLETALVQVWIREDSTNMWEAPEWYLDDCKVSIMGNKRLGTPGPWMGWEYRIKVLR